MSRAQKMPNIDFRSIRQHHGTCHGGFEELVVSLFRYQYGPPFDIIRIDGAGGDGGIEAYTNLPSGGIVGLQAKFFEKLGAPQFRQIAKSLKTARNNHSDLTTYVVATRQNLTPTQAKRWTLLRTSAKRSRPSLNLIWWGESELVELLTRPEHSGRLVYWFGAAAFDKNRLKSHNLQARNDLDTRYTPANHVRVHAQRHLDAIAQAPEFIAEYYELARRVWITWRSSVAIRETEKISETLTKALENAKRIGLEELPRLGDGKNLPSWSEAAEATRRLEEAHLNVEKELSFASKQAVKQAEESDSKSLQEEARQRKSRIEYWKRNFEKSYRQLASLTGFIEQFRCVESTVLLVTGEAGTGKSHLLANFVEELEAREQIALFFLGEYFTSSTEPWSQLITLPFWGDDSETLLAALNFAGEVSGKHAFLIVDALNESSDRQVWQNHLAGFASRLRNWPWVRLVVSCRSDFLRLTIPSRIREGRESGWEKVEHRGFGTATFDAVRSYFEGYGVKVRDYPPLLPEFENPLFLKTFAEAFSGREIPSGPLSLDRVMSQRIRVTCEHIQKKIDCPFDATESALSWLAGAIERNRWQPISIIEARKGIDSHFVHTGQSRSLYHHLKSSGLVVEVGNYDFESENQVCVRFAYERFSDYFIAKRVLAKIDSVDALRSEWRSRGYDAWNGWSEYHRNRGLMRALAILVPEQFGFELVELLDGEEVREELMRDFLLSLPWRSPSSIGTHSRDTLRKAQEIVSWEEIVIILLRLSSIVGHPWNADFLNSLLKPMPVADRDCEWTITISEMLDRGRSVPEFLLQWLYRVETEHISHAQAHLIGTVLTWFFSSNDRGFRQRATFAAIKLLLGKSEVVARLVRDFHNVNDPYVVERVYAVAAGVAAREHDSSKLVVLATAVWETMFASRVVKPHLYARHYAYMVIERASHHGAIPSGVRPSEYKPPYRSKWPRIWKEKEARAWGAKEGWNTIIHSIEPEYGNGIGGYGDFGRYVMQAHVHQWANIRRNKPYPDDENRHVFDENLARRWVLQRIIELGWTPEKFSDYEKRLLHGRQRVDIEERKAERIGKKYQWIALRELEALLSDHFHLSRSWRDDDTVFEGVWQLYSSDFDPTQPLEDPALEYVDDNVYEESVGRNAKPVASWINYPDPFRDEALTRNRSAWVRQIPDNPGDLLQSSSVPGLPSDTLLLGLWQSWDEPDWFPPREPGDGVPHIYMHVRAWVVPRKDCVKWLNFLRDTHFWGDGVSLPELGASDLSEYPAAARFERFREGCENEYRFGKEFPPGLGHAACIYSNSACIPSPKIIDILGIKWSGKDFDFFDSTGTLVSTSPRHEKSDLAPCFVRRDKLVDALSKHNLTLLWGVIGEKYCFDHDLSHHHVADSRITFSGVYYLDRRDRIKGGLTMRDITNIPVGDHQHEDAYSQVMELLPFGTKLPNTAN